MNTQLPVSERHQVLGLLAIKCFTVTGRDRHKNKNYEKVRKTCLGKVSISIK